MTAGLDDLIARLEGATEGSEVLDRAIEYAVNRNAAPKYHLPQRTRSLDAAITLVPAELHWLVRSDVERGGFANVQNDYASHLMRPTGSLHSDPNSWPSWAATPTLALCIAALRARKAALTQGG